MHWHVLCSVFTNWVRSCTNPALNLLFMNMTSMPNPNCHNLTQTIPWWRPPAEMHSSHSSEVLQQHKCWPLQTISLLLQHQSPNGCWFVFLSHPVLLYISLMHHFQAQQWQKKKKLFCRYSLRYCRVVTSQKLQKMLMTHLAPGAIQKCLAYLHFFAIEHLWTGGVRCLGERRRPVSVPRCFMELLDGSISLVCDL